MAAKATFALKAGVWFRRGRLLMISPDSRQSSPLSGRKSTYRSVQICPATSDTHIHRARFAGLDLTDASLDFTDERWVIHWTLPTNLIVKSNSLQIACVGRVQPSDVTSLVA